MTTKKSQLPTTGQVLEFLVKCFGECKGKGVRGTRPGKGKRRAGPDWALYKRIKRLAKECQQSKPVSRETEDALIDAVAALFDTSLQGGQVSKKIRGMSLPERMQAVLPPLHDAGVNASRFTLGLVFWIVYFIEHHEWLRPQLEAAHAPDETLWQWVNHAAHLYTNTFADSVRANPWLFAGVPGDLSWNLPERQPDGTVKWPMCHAVEWLEDRLDAHSRKALPSAFYRNREPLHSARCFARLRRGTHLPGLENIKRCAEYPWQYRSAKLSISRDRLKAVLLWSRALQFALKAVEKRFGLNSVWVLVEWHKRAVASTSVELRNPRLFPFSQDSQGV